MHGLSIHILVERSWLEMTEMAPDWINKIRVQETWMPPLLQNSHFIKNKNDIFYGQRETRASGVPLDHGLIKLPRVHLLLEGSRCQYF